MSATIHEPYLLSSHSVSSVSKKSKGKGIAFGERPYVSASFATSPKHDDGLVTLAVNGEGVHVYDLADLHSVSSHTLGPLTSFWAPPLTVVAVEDGKSLRRTYVPVKSAQDVDLSDAGKVIWSWKEAEGDVALTQDKASTNLQQDASHILSLPKYANSLLIVGKDGQLALADHDLYVKATWSPEKPRRIMQVFAFSRENAQFVNVELSSSDDVLVTVFQDGLSLFIQVIGISQNGTIEALEPQIVSAVSSKNYIGVALCSSGFLTILEANGKLSTFIMDTRRNSLALNPVSDALQLRGFSFLEDSDSNKVASAKSASIQSLGSSYVLLAGFSTSREIALLLWDVQYGILLHSHMLPIPSSFEKDRKSISVSLVQGSNSQAILVLSSNSIKEGSDRWKASAFVVPFTVQRSSTIASALGRAGKPNAWLVPRQPEASTASNELTPSDLKQKEELLERLETAMKKGKIDEAEKIYFEWLGPNKTDDHGRSKHSPPPVTASTIREASPGDAQDATMIDASATAKSRAKVLDHTFVTRILQIILQAEDLGRKTHPHAILRHLIVRHVLTYNMSSSDLFGILIQREDWDCIARCLQNLTDVPELASMRALAAVTKHHRTKQSSDENAMTIDQPNDSKIPHLRSFFAWVVEYPASQASLRLAIREHFSDAEDIVAVLAVLVEWMDHYASRPDLLLELGDVSENEYGIPIVNASVSRKTLRMKGGGRLPSLEHILSFLQALLDSSFLLLLQTPSSHKLLYRISAGIAPHLVLNGDLEGLRGPLYPFAKAQKKVLADATAGRKKDEVDWRKRRKEAHEQASINLGPYQVEELVF